MFSKMVPLKKYDWSNKKKISFMSAEKSIANLLQESKWIDLNGSNLQPVYLTVFLCGIHGVNK